MTKTAVITGSAAGLGKGIAQRLANDGFNIVIQDINQKALEKTEQEFKENIKNKKLTNKIKQAEVADIEDENFVKGIAPINQSKFSPTMQ